MKALNKLNDNINNLNDISKHILAAGIIVSIFLVLLSVMLILFNNFSSISGYDGYLSFFAVETAVTIFTECVLGAVFIDVILKKIEL